MKFLFKVPLLNIIIILAITGFFAYWVPNVKIDNDVSKMLPDHDPARIIEDQFTDDFGGTDIMLVALKAKHGTIFDVEKLKIISELSNEFEKIHLVDSVSSLTNADFVENVNGEIVSSPMTGEYGELLPTNAKEMLEFKRKVLSWDVYKKNIYSTDFKSTSLIINLEAEEKISEVINKNNDNYISNKHYSGIVSAGSISEPKQEVETEETKMGEEESDDFGDLGLDDLGYGSETSSDVPNQITFTYTIDGTEYTATVNPEGKVIGDLIKGKIDFTRGKYSLKFAKKLDSNTPLSISYTYSVATPQHKQIYNKVMKIVEKYKGNQFEVYTSGMPALTVLIGDNMQGDLKNLIPFVILIVIISLALSFKRFGGVVLPLLTVLISAIWAVGLMGLLGVRMTLVSTVIPVILIAVGSAYGIHILTHYYEEIHSRKSRGISKEENIEIIMHILKVVGVPVFLAAITTSVGFLSLLTSPIAPLKDLGLFTSIGVFAALIVAIIFIPSILLLKHKTMAPSEEEMTAENSIMTRMIMATYHFMAGRTYRFLIFTVLLLGASVWGILQINIDSQVIKNFKKSSFIVKADEFLNEHFSGTNTVDIKVTSTEPGGMTNPRILKAMDNLSLYLEDKYDEIGKVTGFHTIIKRMNQIMNSPEGSEEKELAINDLVEILNNVTALAPNSDMTVSDVIKYINYQYNIDGVVYDEIPIDPSKYNAKEIETLRKLIAQYLAIFSGDLTDMAGPDQLAPDYARMTAIVKNVGSGFLKPLKEDINQYVKESFPEGYTIDISGSGEMSLAVNDLVVVSQIASLLLAMFVVFLIIAISFKSPMAGLIGIVPLSASIILNFGFMGFFNIDLNIATSIIASIAIGTGVDYTIHFLSAYVHQRKLSDDLEVVTKKTLVTSGKAIIFNAASVGFGFAVLMGSNFVPLINTGILASLIMFTSSIGAMTLLPVLLKLIKPKFLERA